MPFCGADIALGSAEWLLERISIRAEPALDNAPQRRCRRLRVHGSLENRDFQQRRLVHTC